MFSIFESKDKVLLGLRPEGEVATVCGFLMRQGFSGSELLGGHIGS